MNSFIAHNRLLFRVTIILLGISIILSVLLSILHAGIEFRRQQQFLSTHLNEFEESHSQTFANMLWKMDIDSAQIHLQGLSQDPYMRFLSLSVPMYSSFTIGTPTQNPAFHKIIPLFYQDEGQKEQVGILVVDGNYEKIVADFRDTIPALILLETAKVFFFTICTVLLFYFLFSRYLTEIVRGTEKLDFETLTSSFRLSRKPTSRRHSDELDRIVVALNEMRERLLLGVHKQQQAEKALQRSEEKYRTLIDTTETGYVIVDNKGRVKDANFQYVRLSGHRKIQEILGHSVQEWTAPHDKERNHLEIQKCLGQGCARNLEIDYIGSLGQVTPVEINATVIDTDEEDELILTMVRDISERRQAANTLADEKERLTVTLRSIGDGVICTDTEGRVTLLNSVAERLTGWQQAEALGLPITDVFQIINEKTRKICTNPVDKVLATGCIVGLANHTALIAQDGREFPIADSGAPIRDRTSQIIGVVLVFRDATDERRQEEERLKVKKLESVGILAGGIAHDFNNILAALLGNINLATIKLEGNKECTEILNEAEKAALRAKNLTGQLLTFSKGGEPITETASIAQVVKESADFITHGSSVKCLYDLPDNLWLVDIDQTQISQVIQNIALNAEQAMPEGGTLRITANNLHDPTFIAAAKGDYLRITISDTGVGIPAKILDKIFDPYFSTKHTGSGLGLAICHSIVNRHNGYITVQSSAEEGTVFTILLPASQNKLAQKTSSPKAPKRREDGKILVMDDEKQVRMIAKKMLEHFGYTVFLASDGEEALHHYKDGVRNKAPFDLVIVDLTIPGGMGGQEAAQRMKEIHADIPIIVSSGYSNDPIMAHYKKHGFAATLVKPYRLDELEQILARTLAEEGQNNDVDKEPAYRGSTSPDEGGGNSKKIEVFFRDNGQP